jgi:endonuclease/exonuclease/phosphatase family metal-dependent hydrolase
MKTKIMFWNVQNAWDYSVTLPEEMAAYLLVDKGLYGRFLGSQDHAVWNEAADALLVRPSRSGLPREELVTAIEGWKNSERANYHDQLAALISVALKAGKPRKILTGAIKKAYIHSLGANGGIVSKSRRGWIHAIVREVDPDILVIVEPATSKSQVNFILDHRRDDISNLQELTGEDQDVGGVWVAYQLAVSLGPSWEVWASPISTVGASIEGKSVHSKQSIFELYTVLWKASSQVGMAEPGRFLPGDYPERTPCGVVFTAPGGRFNLIFTHAVFGKPPQRRQTLSILGQDLKAEHFTTHPTIVMGDFNLDYGAQVNRRRYDGLGMGSSLIAGEPTTFTAIRTGKPGSYRKSAYDQVFVRGIPSVLGSGVFDFAHEMFRLDNAFLAADRLPFNPFGEVRKVSDHLPVWCEIDFPA